MYEIWLAMNIVYEIGLGIWPLLLAALLAWLALMAAARRRLNAPALRGAVAVGVLVAAVLVVAVPSLTQSSLRNMGYWVDWANLAAIALGLGALATVLAWPVLALACPRCRSRA